MTAVANSLIVLDEGGRAWIDGANTQVIQVAMDEVAHGWSADEIHRQHSHLSMAQIHAALSYYYEHKPIFDAEIEADLALSRRELAAQGETPLRRRLRELGKLS